VRSRFSERLRDLTQEREGALRERAGPAMVRLVLLVLVYGRSAQLNQRLPGWRALLDEAYGAASGKEDVAALFHYLAKVGMEEDMPVTRAMLNSLVGERQAEELMSGFMKEYTEKGRQQGEAKGQAKAVLQILKMRGVHVDLKSSERILACTDLATLELWLERAMKATGVSQVLADPNH
jgi:hypothetical protein